MKTLNTRTLLTTVAYAAFTLTIASGPALAFDEVNWEWNKLVDDNVVKTLNVNIDSNPTGQVAIEKIQSQIGDVNANSTVTGVHNNTSSLGTSGTVNIDETMTVTTNYDKPIGVGSSVNASSGIVSNDPNGILTGTFNTGTLSEQQNAYTDIIDVNLKGEVALENVNGVNNAIDLPAVESAATAVGNNQSINTTTSVDLHDGQFLIGGFAAGTDTTNATTLENVLASTPDSGNTHTDVAAALRLAGALGLITPAQVSANSIVDDVVNASVDSAATAVGNNMSVNVTPATPDDALVLADLTQFSYADVTGTSSVTNVSVNDYTNFGAAGMGPLGDPQKPLVSSVATAVGNNMAITVSPGL